jgi:hypothetical protein
MRLDRAQYEPAFSDEFDGDDLDRSNWIPHYLPQWSTREQSKARYRLGDGRLALLIEEDQEPWSREHNGELRVSNLQTGVFSGPVGSDVGQHHFTSGLKVSEAQTEQRLYTPHFGLVEARVAAIRDPQSMVALWMIGFEDAPHRSAEICIFEIFGSDVHEDHAVVGVGVHPFGDPDILDDFRKVRLGGDATEFHTYSVEWLPNLVRFFIDDELVAQQDQSPDYPMQLMLNVYEFSRHDEAATPYPKEFLVDWVRGFRQIGT